MQRKWVVVLLSAALSFAIAAETYAADAKKDHGTNPNTSTDDKTSSDAAQKTLTALMEKNDVLKTLQQCESAADIKSANTCLDALDEKLKGPEATELKKAAEKTDSQNKDVQLLQKLLLDDEKFATMMKEGEGEPPVILLASLDRRIENHLGKGAAKFYEGAEQKAEALAGIQKLEGSSHVSKELKDKLANFASLSLDDKKGLVKELAKVAINYLDVNEGYRKVFGKIDDGKLGWGEKFAEHLLHNTLRESALAIKSKGYELHYDEKGKKVHLFKDVKSQRGMIAQVPDTGKDYPALVQLYREATTKEAKKEILEQMGGKKNNFNLEMVEANDQIGAPDPIKEYHLEGISDLGFHFLHRDSFFNVDHEPLDFWAKPPWGDKPINLTKYPMNADLLKALGYDPKNPPADAHMDGRIETITWTPTEGTTNKRTIYSYAKMLERYDVNREKDTGTQWDIFYDLNTSSWYLDPASDGSPVEAKFPLGYSVNRGPLLKWDQKAQKKEGTVALTREDGLADFNLVNKNGEFGLELRPVPPQRTATTNVAGLFNAINSTWDTVQQIPATVGSYVNCGSS